MDGLILYRYEYSRSSKLEQWGNRTVYVYYAYTTCFARWEEVYNAFGYRCYFLSKWNASLDHEWLIDSIMCALKKIQTKWVHFDPFWFVQMIHILIFLTDENLTFLLPTCVRVPVVKLCLRYCIYYIRTGRCSSLLHVTCSSHSLLSLLPYITSIWDRGRIGTIGGNTSSSGFALVDSFF